MSAATQAADKQKKYNDKREAKRARQRIQARAELKVAMAHLKQAKAIRKLVKRALQRADKQAIYKSKQRARA